MARLSEERVVLFAREASDIVLTAIGATEVGSIDDYGKLTTRALSTVAHRHGVRLKARDVERVLTAMLTAWSRAGIAIGSA